MRSLRLTDRRRLVLRVIALCLFLSATVFFLDARGHLDRAELWTIDSRFWVRGARHPRSDSRVVVVGIDDYSLSWMADERDPLARDPSQTYGNWPWPRSAHARLVTLLTQAGARVIAFDILFADQDRHPTRQGLTNDTVFARAMSSSGRVLLAMQEARTERLAIPGQESSGAVNGKRGGKNPAAATEMPSVAQPLSVPLEQIEAFDALQARSASAPQPLPEALQPPTHSFLWILPWNRLTAAAHNCGFIDIDPDLDSVYRRVMPVKAADSGRLYLHLGVAAAAAALGVKPEQLRVAPDGTVHLGRQRSLPVDPDGRLLIDFAGPATRRTGPGRLEMSPSAFPYVPYYAVLSRKIPMEQFRDKVVFVGAVARGLADVRPNPYDVAGSGVDISAHLADAILSNRMLRGASPVLLPAVMLGLVLLLCRALTARTPAGATVAMLAIAGPYLAVAQLCFSYAMLVLPLATPMLTIVACYTGVMTLRFATEQREQQRVRRFLERYVTPEVATEVLEDPEAAQLGGRRREVTMLFSDIRGFTTMSEQLSAEVVIELLNQYFAVMIPIIERYRGTTNNFIGDAIFAFWGAPLEQADQAERAVLCGLEMLEAMPALQERWRSQGLPAFEIGIGVHHGTAVIGNIGTEQRSHYTTIGDDVNIAARLESANSVQGTKFLISSAVHERVAHLVEARLMPPLRVKNKAEPLTVYEVLGRRGAPTGTIPAEADGKRSSGVHVFRTSAVGDSPS